MKSATKPQQEGAPLLPFGSVPIYQATDVVISSPADDGDALSDTSASAVGSDEHKTTVLQTFVHLLKGYIGVGMLSLPWAVSQLGVPMGFVSVFVMAFW